MDLWQLRTFCAVARTLNFTRASENLNLSQPAVSQQIKLLEREMGEPLFVRSNEGINLTAAGEVMNEHALSILNTVDELHETLVDPHEKLQGNYVLGVTSQGLDIPLFGVYQSFKERYPLIDLKIHSEDKIDVLIRAVEEGNVDVAIAPNEMDLASVESIPLGNYRLELVVGKNHRFASMDVVPPEELNKEDWVMFDKSSRLRALAERCFAKIGVEPESIYETNDGSMIRTMVSKGNHISCLPSWGVSSDVEYGGIVPVPVEGVEPRMQVNLIWKKGRKSRALSAVISHLQECEIGGVEMFYSKLEQE